MARGRKLSQAEKDRAKAFNGGFGKGIITYMGEGEAFPGWRVEKAGAAFYDEIQKMTDYEKLRQMVDRDRLETPMEQWIKDWIRRNEGYYEKIVRENQGMVQ